MTFITQTQTGYSVNPFRSIWNAVIRASEASLNNQGRVDQMQKLSEKTDAELAEMGLSRDDIARYVFRDLIYI